MRQNVFTICALVLALMGVLATIQQPTFVYPVLPTPAATPQIGSGQDAHSPSAPIITRNRVLQQQMEVSARSGWQSTNLEVNQGEAIRIQVIGGKWTYWQGEAPYNGGEGTVYICTDFEPVEDCDEPYPSVPADALIGRIGVGGELFLVGNKAIIEAPSSGTLFLRINDDDAGLDDNNGSLGVSIVIQS